MKEIANNTFCETIINKSKFIAYSFVCHKTSDVENYLTKLKKEHSTATHICYAYKIWPNEEKCFDDGEPQGTAGKPILDVIKKSKFDNLFVVVVRYFGGIKLGAGGLLRAYSNSASSVLSLSGEKISVECKKLTFKISLSESKFVKLIENINLIKKIEVEYLDDVLINIFVEKSDIESLKIQIQQILKKELNFIEDENNFYV